MNLKKVLDGKDWEVDFFITETQYQAWVNRERTIDRMHMYSAQQLGFIRPGVPAPGAMRGTVPGCDVSVLLENGRIPDINVGRNLEVCRWVERFSWGFRKHFTFSPEWKNCRQIRLTLKGIDYSAEIFFNGVNIGRHTGMFLPFEYDITRLVNPEGENLLAVIFDPAPQACPNHQEKNPAEFAYYHRHQMGFGWDWARAAITTGIWDHVEIHGYGAARMKDVFFRYLGDGRCSAALDVEALEDCTLPLAIRLTPDGFAGKSAEYSTELKLRAGSNHAEVTFNVEDPHLWFPNGYGEQPLYNLEIDLGNGMDRYCRKAGLRTIAMARNPNSPEGAYDQTFVINGVKIFVRGLNWVPADLLFYCTGREDYERLVKLAAVSGFNLFRSWGGGLIEKTEFFECCDKYGMMVWQEFPHGCSNSPKDPDYLAYSEVEGESILRKIRNHVCLSLICGGNEVLYYGEIPNSPMFKTYAEQVARLTPDLAFHISCPDLSRPGERNHGPWWMESHEFYNKHDRIIATEIGCNGMPEEESVRRFIPENEPLPEGQSYHYHFLHLQKAPDLHRQWEPFGPETLWEHCQSSMFVQADITGYQMEHYRRGWPEKSGCFFWQYNEPWPTFTWSLLDYYSVPKLAMYRLAKSNAPVMLSLQDQDWCVKDGIWRGRLYLCNDRASFDGAAELQLWSMEGKELAAWKVAGPFVSGVSLLGEWESPVPENTIVIAVMTLRDAAGGEIFRTERLYGVPDYRPAFHAPAADVEAVYRKVPGGITVTLNNRGGNAAMMVRVSLPDDDPKLVYWYENYVTLAPGERRELFAECAALPERVQIRGWNVPAADAGNEGLCVIER